MTSRCQAGFLSAWANRDSESIDGEGTNFFYEAPGACVKGPFQRQEQAIAA
jgi:hypothetical protein